MTRIRPSHRGTRVVTAFALAIAAPAMLAVEPVAAITTLPAQIYPSFAPAVIKLNATSVLTLSILDPNDFGVTSVAFTDTLPSGLVVANPSGLTNDCGGTATATAGSGTISLSAGGPTTGCEVSVNVTGTSFGAKVDSVSMTSSAGTGDVHQSTLTVAIPPQASATFDTTAGGPLPYTVPGVTVGLGVELHNGNTTAALTGLGFSSTLPAGLTIASPNNLVVTGGCTAGEVTAAAGTHLLALAGATLDASSGNLQQPAPGEYCEISLNVVAGTSGAQFFSTGPIAASDATPGSAGTATLPVFGPGARVYWGNNGAGGPDSSAVGFARLDGSVGATLTQSAGSGIIAGTAIDATAGRVYWNDIDHEALRWATLGNTAHGTVATTGASYVEVEGLAFNAATGRLYWAGYNTNTIGWADVHAGTAGNLYSSGQAGGATIGAPSGVAIDPAANRIYWSNSGTNVAGISYANLDGTGNGHDLSTTGATLSAPFGLALDAADGLVYWVNTGNSSISYAHLDGSGGGNLTLTALAGAVSAPIGNPTLPAVIGGPEGLAFDPTLRRLVWANYAGATLGYQDLGAGDGTIGTPGITVQAPTFPSILYPPQPTAAPTLTGSGKPGVLLTCGKGTWAADLPGSQLYRVPASYAYHWQRNGSAISGAVASTYTPSATGDYTCTVTAANAAGSTTSAPSRIADSLAPTVSAPIVTLAVGSTVGTTASVRLTWSGSDAGSGIAHYEVWLSTNGGSYVKVSSPTGTSYARALTISSTTTHRFRVRAFDKAGNVSAFVYGTTFRVKLVQQTSTSVHWSGSWTTTTTTSASGGSYRSATSAGASVAYTFTGRGIGVVATEGTGFGSFKVYLDGVLVGTVSDYATSTVYRRMVYSKAWSTWATHTIKLVSVGTAGHPKIDLDAFVLLA